MTNQPLCIRTGEIAPRPWRNGGGVTRELLAWPDAVDWRVRLSVADIDRDGPFSAFPGVERWFAVLEGAGVELGIDQRAQCVRRGEEAVRFAGEASVQCRLLDGPTRDLNLMLHGVSGAMRLALDGAAWNPSPGTACGFYGLVAGQCGVEHAGPWARSNPMAEHTLLWFGQAPRELCFAAASNTGGQPVGYWLTAGISA